MARARNIKPSFFMNEALVELPFEARLLFIGLWTLADREGRLEDRPKRIKMEVFPGDDVNVEVLLDSLKNSGFILRYEACDKNYIQVVNFIKHQSPHHKEVESKIPPPNGYPKISKETYDVTEDQRQAIFDRDGRVCLCCGSTESLALDHVIPLAKGGNNDASNLQTLCISCNSSKKDKTIDYRKAKHGSSINHACVKHGASCPPDILNPDILNPDILNPETINTDSSSLRSEDKAQAPKKEKIKTSVSVTDLFNDGISKQIAAEFLDLRKKRKSSLSPYIWDEFKKEAAFLHFEFSMSLEDCIKFWMSETNWTGFKADWVRNKLAENAQPRASPAKSKQAAVEESNAQLMKKLLAKGVPNG